MTGQCLEAMRRRRAWTGPAALAFSISVALLYQHMPDAFLLASEPSSVTGLRDFAETATLPGRRAALAVVGTGCGALLEPHTDLKHNFLGPPQAWAADQKIKERFERTDLERLPGRFFPWEPKRPDDLYYPSWMEGRWHVQAKLVNYGAPLGLRFVGRDMRIAAQSLAEQRKRLGQVVEYDLQYVKTKRGHIAEDKIFSAASRTNAYAGRQVVKKVEYVDMDYSNRQGSMQSGDAPDDPLRTIILYFKGGLQRVFVTSFLSEAGEANEEPEAASSMWRASVNSRTLFGAPGAGYNPLTVDEELLTEFQRVSQPGEPEKVRGRVRLAGFLNPQDPLYFDSGNKAVTIADYELELSRPATTATDSKAAAEASMTAA
eukprot:TRINITY_DN106803_c0_g1_i1.p1 TRINITY_DN106803_c0_g1~~TRINITY_DN106803_c0_g1_i1.p1  ORF type:complete len:374 (-),score=46.26 TRINITY_DN106803_c0_g1_i1:6-1127(-)